MEIPENRKVLYIQTKNVAVRLGELAKYSTRDKQINLLRQSPQSHLPQLGSLKNLEVIMPFQRSLSPTVPATYTYESKVFSDNLLRIASINPEVDIMSSLARPKKIRVVATDGNMYQFLCKPNDDPRVDARVMEVLSLVNGMLRVNPDSRKRNFCTIKMIHIYIYILKGGNYAFLIDIDIRTYSVLPLSETEGLIEWVPDTITLKGAVYSFQDPPILPVNKINK